MAEMEATILNQRLDYFKSTLISETLKEKLQNCSRKNAILIITTFNTTREMYKISLGIREKGRKYFQITLSHVLF